MRKHRWTAVGSSDGITLYSCELCGAEVRIPSDSSPEALLSRFVTLVWCRGKTAARR